MTASPKDPRTPAVEFPTAPMLALCLGLLAGCASTTGASAGAATATTAGPGNGSAPAQRFVLVPEDAWLRSGPDESAEGARVISRPAGGGEVLVFRALREQGDWLAVQTLSAHRAREHCYDRARGLDPYRLTLFVRRDAVRAVTAREVSVHYGDGSFATLAAGVALVPAPALALPGRTVYTVYASGLMFNTWLDADAVGREYSPGARFDTSTTDLLVHSLGSLTFGGGARVGAYARGALPVPAADRQDEGGATRVTLRTPCVQLRARVDPSDLEGVLAGLTGREAPGEAPAGPVVSRGARVYWPDGRTAGRVRRDTALPPEAEPAGGRRCFRAPLAPPRPGRAINPEHALRLCFDPADVH